MFRTKLTNFHKQLSRSAGLLLTLFCGVSTLSVVGVTAAELVNDPKFLKQGDGLKWWSTDSVIVSRGAQKICAQTLSATSEPWDAIIGLDGFKLRQGENYTFTIGLTDGQGQTIRALIQEGQDPWTPYAELVETASVNAQEYQLSFLAGSSSDKAQIVIQFGGVEKGSQFCLNKVSLADEAQTVSNISPDQIAVHVNQLGYLPNGPKRANLIHPSQTPLPWRLKSSDGQMLANGRTRPFGFDPSSGFDTHIIDFSKFKKPATGLKLEVEGVESDAFSIDDQLYDRLRVDAMSYFYLVRSGTDISSKIAGKTFARPAGHVADQSVKCLKTSTAKKIYGKAWSCDYKLDVSGGWYDAGDFGKYVVNGGLSVAQIMSSYERALYFAGSRSKLLGQDLLRLPNQSSNLPDVLVEAKWELDFLMKMQVPKGKPLAGLVHHKIHGVEWNGLPLWPHKDSVGRVLHRPSTAATLNLAATAAMGERLFAPYDKDYAAKLLAASVAAYQAALKTPDLLAPNSGGQYGGGDYDDVDVSDEFYWAESELFITTGDNTYLNNMKESRHWSSGVFQSTGMSWQFLAGLARLQLAATPNELPQDDRLKIQNSVLIAAENFIAIQKNEGFDIMFKADEGLGWGSNHSIIQNMIVTAVAYDLVKDVKYLNAVRSGMDYILGRNAIGMSYVTGHGTRSPQNQHARIFAQNIDPAFPPMPHGALAGGANSWPSDDIAIEQLKDCAPQTCYIDDHRSYSTNEIAINWNASLAWIASFLADTSKD
jgi:endoglucanase